MLANDVIYHELRRLVALTARLESQVSDLTSRLDSIERQAGSPVLLSGAIPFEDAPRPPGP
jgi:hypothetical protein